MLLFWSKLKRLMRSLVLKNHHKNYSAIKRRVQKYVTSTITGLICIKSKNNIFVNLSNLNQFKLP